MLCQGYNTATFSTFTILILLPSTKNMIKFKISGFNFKRPPQNYLRELPQSISGNISFQATIALSAATFLWDCEIAYLKVKVHESSWQSFLKLRAK